MGKFASGTSVSVERTKAEIETLLRRYGADQYLPGSDWSAGKYFIQFRYRGYYVRFHIAIPPATDARFARTPGGKIRTPLQRQQAQEQHERETWRSLLLVIKARLEAVEAGIESFEEAFLARIVTPNGQTVGEHVVPQLAAMYATGRMPAGLLMGPAEPPPATEGEGHATG